MSKPPFRLIFDDTLEFLFLFSNADGFYVSARYNLLHGWVVPGCSNAHQAVELYIKSILRLNHEKERGHDLIALLSKYKNREAYFKDLLENVAFSELLRELSAAYLVFRYGEAGAESNSSKIIDLLDEMAWNLRKIYLENIKSPSMKIYVPIEAKEDFCKNNKFFSDKDTTSNSLAQFGLPI